MDDQHLGYLEGLTYVSYSVSIWITQMTAIEPKAILTSQEVYRDLTTAETFGVTIRGT